MVLIYSNKKNIF